MKKIHLKYIALGLALSIVVGVVVIKIFKESFIDEDHIERPWPGGIEGYSATNLEKAALDVRDVMFGLLHYITRCERFPLNLEDAYKPIDNGSNNCRPMKPTDEGIVAPWIDPWERSYQIRYHKERRKLQVRSRGRNLDEESDDIVRETNLTIHRDIYNAEIEKCKKLPSDDKDCVFNRGWH